MMNSDKTDDNIADTNIDNRNTDCDTNCSNNCGTNYSTDIEEDTDKISDLYAHMAKEEEAKERIMDLLEEVDIPLSSDTIYVILQLEHEMELYQGLIDNMKEGRIEAAYDGKSDKEFNIEHVSFKLKKRQKDKNKNKDK